MPSFADALLPHAGLPIFTLSLSMQSYLSLHRPLASIWQIDGCHQSAFCLSAPAWHPVLLPASCC